MDYWMRRAITTIRERYDEPLCLDDLARTATMSKFHFLRTFRLLTGMTPVRFLSAVRIQEAKRLLVTTPLNVADISVQVGYGSLGTFTRRFTECVGLPPTLYRRMARGEQISMFKGAQHTPGLQSGTLYGIVESVPATSSPIFLGVFGRHIPQGQPVAYTTVGEAGPWQMTGVPAGSWHLVAAAADTTPDDGAYGPAVQPPLVSTICDIRVEPGVRTSLDVTIRPLEWRRPPLLFAVPGIEKLRAVTAIEELRVAA
jgi:AraC family transcriptional regulator